MPSLGRGETNSITNIVLDLFVAVQAGPVLTDVAQLRFRIEDISTPVKRATPVQVFPVGVLGTFFELDPTNPSPGPGPNPGVRIGVGHYFAPYTVDLAEPIGDHRIVWEFNNTTLSPAETLTEEFFVTAAAVPVATQYCTIADVRAEGFAETLGTPPVATDWTDTRISLLIDLASRYIDAMTERWFEPRVFTSANQFKVDGKGGRVLFFPIPIIAITKIEIEDQGATAALPTAVDLAEIRTYNRHMSNQTLPDDRENPRIEFLRDRQRTLSAANLLQRGGHWTKGKQNVLIEGTLGYTDWDAVVADGVTPNLIKRACCLLVIRDIELEEGVDAVARRNRFRIISDKEGDTTIRLQNLWLKGHLTGDLNIDMILARYKRPIAIGIA